MSRLSTECESIISEIAQDAVSWFLGFASLCIAMASIIYLFAAAGAAL